VPPKFDRCRQFATFVEHPADGLGRRLVNAEHGYSMGDGTEPDKQLVDLAAPENRPWPKPLIAHRTDAREPRCGHCRYRFRSMEASKWNNPAWTIGTTTRLGRSRKHGNTLISTLRQTYVSHFDCPAEAKLIEVTLDVTGRTCELSVSSEFVNPRGRH
jgi:hypothetical protein